MYLLSTWSQGLWIIPVLLIGATIFFGYKAIVAGRTAPILKTWWFWSAVTCGVIAIIVLATKGLE